MFTFERDFENPVLTWIEDLLQGYRTDPAGVYGSLEGFYCNTRGTIPHLCNLTFCLHERDPIW